MSLSMPLTFLCLGTNVSETVAVLTLTRFSFNWTGIRLRGSSRLCCFSWLSCAALPTVAYLKKMRMTKQEVKDELKQTDGDPHVKARLRQIRQERARTRMMAAVPEADVVVTNPTHYAIALKPVQD